MRVEEAEQEFQETAGRKNLRCCTSTPLQNISRGDTPTITTKYHCRSQTRSLLAASVMLERF